MVLACRTISGAVGGSVAGCFGSIGRRRVAVFYAGWPNRFAGGCVPTGFVAGATAAAIKNPDTTAILIEEGESPSDHDDSVIANALADELVKHHDAIFTDVGELADYLDEIDQEEST